MATSQSMLEQQFAELSSAAHAALLANRLAEAEKQFRDLIQLRMRAWGPENVDTLDSQINHAAAFVALQRHAEAEAKMREVLQVLQQTPSFGMEHDLTLYTVSHLGRFLLAQGRFKEAARMLRKVHALQLRLKGPRHEKLLDIQTTLGNSLAEGGQYEEAEQLLRDALEGYRVSADDPDRPDLKASAMGAVMLDLAKCLSKAGKHVEAESLLRAAVKHARHNLGEEDALTIMCMQWHASVLGKLEKHAAAEVMWKLTVESSRALFGWAHPQTLTRTCFYARCLLDQNKLAAMQSLLHGTHSHVQQASGERHAMEWMMELARFL